MRIPTATYRIQFHAGFGFNDLRRTLPYLAELGISDVYASPVLESAPGSKHGYDVCSPDRLDPELGSRSDFELLSASRKDLDIGWIQDIVPNHMAYHDRNARLMDVLENGPDSDYSSFFDVDWDHPSFGKSLLLPFLGAPYEKCLVGGEFEILFDRGLFLGFSGMRFPLRLETYGNFLAAPDHPEATTPEDRSDFLEMRGMLAQAGSPGAGRKERADNIKKGLGDLCARSGFVRNFLKKRIDEVNRRSADGFKMMHPVIAGQFFRPAFWKTADSELNYRRFFIINGLIGIKTEEDRVFEEVHSETLKWIRAGAVTGVRIDHIDGLLNPTAYAGRLRRTAGDVYIVAEKILRRGEVIPDDWPIQGTTGYDFAEEASAALCDSDSERTLDRIYRDFTGFTGGYPDLFLGKRLEVLDGPMWGDLDNIAWGLKRIAEATVGGRDLAFRNLRDALREAMAGFGAYRTYLRCGEADTEKDRNLVRESFAAAKARRPDLETELSFIERGMLCPPGEKPAVELDLWRPWVLRLQQFTGSLMAKGIEDTAFYVYNRFISRNEVGGEPGIIGASPGEFHSFLERRAHRWPHAMNATSTHDTKRGEDVRMRINVLSEIAGRWGEKCLEWKKLNRSRKKMIGGRALPDGNMEFFLYQTLLGAWPLRRDNPAGFTARIKEYMLKAAREAKVFTSWSMPDAGYESALLDFADEILDPSPENFFPASFAPFQREVSFYGCINSLSQLLIKIAAPGVPDFYQGTELWHLDLVDPDNRRSVDFDLRSSLLGEIVRASSRDLPGAAAEYLADWEDGRIKMFLMWRALQARKTHRILFQNGIYRPVEITGNKSNNAIAFLRQYRETQAAVVVPRLAASLVEPGRFPLGSRVWGDTALLLPETDAAWTDVLTGTAPVRGGNVFLGEILENFPAALLLSGNPP